MGPLLMPRPVTLFLGAALLSILVAGCSFLDSVAALLTPTASAPTPDPRTLIYDTYKGPIKPRVYPVPPEAIIPPLPKQARIFVPTPTPAPEPRTLPPGVPQARALSAGLEKAGFSKAPVTVVRDEKSNQTIATVSLTITPDFQVVGAPTGGRAGMIRAFEELADLNRKQQMGITVTTVQLKDEKGNPVMELAAPVQAAQDLKDGRINLEQFQKRAAVKVQDRERVLQLMQDATKETAPVAGGRR